MRVTLSSVSLAPANLYGRLGFAPVGFRWRLALAPEPLANTFMLDPLGSVQWRFVMSADHPLAHVSGPLTSTRCAVSRQLISKTARTLTKRVTGNFGAEGNYRA